jgi:hypothetical protein
VIKQRAGSQTGVVASIAAALEVGPRIGAEQKPCDDPCRQPCKRPGGSWRARLKLPDARDQSLIVRTTDDVGRLLTVGSFISFATYSSYCASVFTGSFARICTTL